MRLRPRARQPLSLVAGLLSLLAAGCAAGRPADAAPPSPAPPASGAPARAEVFPPASSEPPPASEAPPAGAAPAASARAPAEKPAPPLALARADAPPCAERRPKGEVCACLQKAIKASFEGEVGPCKTVKQAGEAKIVLVPSKGRHAGDQYFVVHEGKGGSSVLALLEQHVPGGGGVYRDFSLDGARVEELGKGRVLVVESSTVETERSFDESGKPRGSRELSREKGATVCVLSSPAGGEPWCLARIRLEARGLDEKTGKAWGQEYSLRFSSSGDLSVSSVGAPAPETARQKLW